MNLTQNIWVFFFFLLFFYILFSLLGAAIEDAHIWSKKRKYILILFPWPVFFLQSYLTYTLRWRVDSIQNISSLIFILFFFYVFSTILGAGIGNAHIKKKGWKNILIVIYFPIFFVECYLTYSVIK